MHTSVRNGITGVVETWFLTMPRVCHVGISRYQRPKREQMATPPTDSSNSADDTNRSAFCVYSFQRTLFCEFVQCTLLRSVCIVLFKTEAKRNTKGTTTVFIKFNAPSTSPESEGKALLKTDGPFNSGVGNQGTRRRAGPLLPLQATVYGVTTEKFTSSAVSQSHHT